jgi:hypothetical protein
MREARRYPATTGWFANRPHLGLLAAAAARLERFPGTGRDRAPSTGKRATSLLAHDGLS